jgi:hypothetical protein
VAGLRLSHHQRRPEVIRLNLLRGRAEGRERRVSPGARLRFFTHLPLPSLLTDRLWGHRVEWAADYESLPTLGW